MQYILRKIDRHPFVGNLLSQSSRFLAVNRGFLMLLGTGLIILSAIATLIVMAIIVGSAEAGMIWLLLCIPAALLHIGLIAGFIGVMMIIPLGQGYEE